MSEATIAEAPEVQTVIMPEKPFVAPDTPETAPEVITPETPEQKAPEVVPEQTPQPKAEETQLQMYQDVVAKHKEDSTYQMSDKECEAFDVIQEKIATKQIEDPGPKKLEEPTKDKEPETAPEGAKPPEDKKEAETNTGLQGISDTTANNIQKAMTKVGAKDVNELPGKIENLLNYMKKSTNDNGNELATLKKEKSNHVAWISDLQAGKPEAIEYLHSITGKPVTPAKADVSAPPSQEGDAFIDEAVDEPVAREVVALRKTVAELKAGYAALQKGDAVRVADTERLTAANGWVDDVVDLVVGSGADFGLSPKEARGLAMGYWGPEGHLKAVHPKFQGIHELIQFANERAFPDLKSAHIVWQHEKGTYAQKLIAATKEGQKTQSHKESVNSFISDKQGRVSSNVPDPQITDERVTAMERGNFNDIPDEWTDDTGTLIPSKVPERFHDLAFGRKGKPQ